MSSAQERLEQLAFAIFATGDIERALSCCHATIRRSIPSAKVLEAVRSGYRAGAGDSTAEARFAAYNLHDMVDFW